MNVGEHLVRAKERLIPGMTSEKHLTFLPCYFHIDLPEAFSQEVDNTPDYKRKAGGVERGFRQSLDLAAGGVSALDFYPLQSSNLVARAVTGIPDRQELFPASNSN